MISHKQFPFTVEPPPAPPTARELTTVCQFWASSDHDPDFAKRRAALEQRWALHCQRVCEMRNDPDYFNRPDMIGDSNWVPYEKIKKIKEWIRDWCWQAGGFPVCPCRAKRED